MLAVVAVGAVAFGVHFAWRSGPSSPTPVAVTIARLPVPHSGLIHIAQARKSFARSGLAATIVDAPTGYEAMTAVLERKADFATAAETPIARALAEGKPIAVVATIFTSQWNSGIVARRDRGISVAADLRGKRIGHVRGTATHYMLETFLAFHRIALADVTLVPLRPDEVVAALVGGTIDAASIWTPYLTRLRAQLGALAVDFPPTDFYSERTNLVVSRDDVRRRPEVIERVLGALYEAERFAQAQPDEAVAIVAKASGMEPAALRGNGDPLTFELTLHQALLLSVENEISWHFDRGLVARGPYPELLPAFATEPLKRVKPSGVTLAK